MFIISHVAMLSTLIQQYYHPHINNGPKARSCLLNNTQDNNSESVFGQNLGFDLIKVHTYRFTIPILTTKQHQYLVWTERVNLHFSRVVSWGDLTWQQWRATTLPTFIQEVSITSNKSQKEVSISAETKNPQNLKTNNTASQGIF